MSGRLRALALHERPGEVAEVLEGDGRLEWAYAENPEEVEPALRAHRPRVVFSLKQASFPGEAHAACLAAESVRWFHVAGSGTDHIDHARREGVSVTDGRGVLAGFLAEREMAGLLHLTTGMGRMLEAGARGLWRPERFRTLEGRRVLVVGAGATGQAFAERAGAFGCRIVGIRASGAMRAGFDEMRDPMALDEELTRADVVALHVRLTEQTRGLMGAERLMGLKDGALVLNAARGPVLDEQGLLDALDGPVAGAWLDVFAQEPLPQGSPLWRHPRVLVSPHQADQVEDFPARLARHFMGLVASQSEDEWLALGS